MQALEVLTWHELLDPITQSLLRIEQLLATRPAEESRSSAAIEENSKAEPAVKLKAYSGDIAELEAVGDEALRVYKKMRVEVMQP